MPVNPKAVEEVFGFDPTRSSGGPLVHPAYLNALPGWKVNYAPTCELCGHPCHGSHDRCVGCRGV